jgi:hypothetical protein
MTLSEMEREIQRLRQEIAIRPIRTGTSGGGGAAVTMLPTVATYQTRGGNSLGSVFGTTITGMKPLGTALTSVPVRVPVVGTTYADGAAYCSPVVAGVVATGTVQWCLSKVTTPSISNTQDYTGWLVTGVNFASIRTIAVPVAGCSTDAVLSATLTGDTITGITITNGGTGYTAYSYIYVVGGGGSGAILSPVITGGVITGVTITNGGTGFTSAPTLAARGEVATAVLPYYA